MKSPLLIIAIDYHQMFKALLDRAPNLKPDVDREIAWAKQHLKKSDRITWYLRWIRLRLISDGERNSTGPDKLPPGSTDKELAALSAKAGKKFTPADIIRDAWRFKRDLEHYMSIEDRDMQSIQWGWQSPTELYEQLAAADKAFKEKAEADKRMLEPQEGDKAFIKFGNGWAWWALSRGYCSEEAKAMGHCGNQGEVTGDQILSLREPRQKGGKDYWEPHLTFIFNTETKMLGEMKGRGNEKPAARYHPYIITLLKDKRIKGITGGGYAPSHNFKLSDLTEEQQTELENLKPALMTLKRMLKKYGIQDMNSVQLAGKLPAPVIKKTMALLGIKKESYDKKLKGFVVYTWNDLPEFVEDKGDRTAKWIMNVDQGNETLDFYETGMNKSEMRDILDSLKPETIRNVGLKLEYEYPNELLDFVEEQGGTESFTWEPDVLSDVKDFLGHLDDQGISTEIDEALEKAVLWGQQSGYEGNMHKELLRAVEDASDPEARITVVHEGKGWWDGKISAVLTMGDAVRAAVACEEDEGCTPDIDENDFVREALENLEIKVGENRDFDDYDEKHAIETAEEELGGPPPVKKKQPVAGQGEIFPEVYEKGAK